MNPITVLLAEDHMVVREGLRVLLNMEPDIHVVGEAENGLQAVAYASKLSPDVVVMDIAMPLLNGLEATRQILKARPDTKIIVLSAHGDEAYIRQARMLGASSYLLKQSAAHVLPEEIRKVFHGTATFSPGKATTLHYP